MVISSVLGIIIILITVRLRLQLIYQITNIQLFNKLCVCAHTLQEVQLWDQGEGAEMALSKG